MSKTDKAHHTGHRDRLRQRFLKNGGDALADYEMLELLLFLGIPRRDVKPLAKELIKNFGSFAAVLNADVDELQNFKGLGEIAITAIKLAKAAGQRLAREEVINQPILSTWERVLDYCQVSMGHIKVEQFCLLFLDKKNRLIADEIQQQGTIDHTPAYPREIVKKALNIGASAMILVHNHPSGDPRPSQADREMTTMIVDAAKAVGITVHDHLIIAKGKHFSFRAEGLL